MNIQEHQTFVKMAADLVELIQVVAQQGIQIAALIATHPTPEKVEAILNPPAEDLPSSLDGSAAAPAILTSAGIAVPVAEQIAIPERTRGKPGPKPRLHGELRTIASGANA